MPEEWVEEKDWKWGGECNKECYVMGGDVSEGL